MQILPTNNAKRLQIYKEKSRHFKNDSFLCKINSRKTLYSCLFSVTSSFGEDNEPNKNAFS